MSGYSPDDDPPDLAPATTARLVQLWREHVRENHPGMMPGYLSAACTHVEALADALAAALARAEAAERALAAAPATDGAPS